MSHRLQVLISADLDAKITKAARQTRVSKDEWVRRALQEALQTSSGGESSSALDRLAALNAPTADIEQMLAEIETGRP